MSFLAQNLSLISLLEKECAQHFLSSQENPNCLLIVTPKGGHLGWVAGPEAPRGAPWTDPVVMDFLQHLERERSRVVPSSNESDAVRLCTHKASTARKCK